MQKQEFISLLSNPKAIDSGQIHRLENLLEEHPYFQAARVLRLKGLKNQNSFLYNSALKKTAAYTADRGILFDFITSKEFGQDRIAREINKQTVPESPKKTSEDINEALRMQLHEAHKILDPGLFEGKKTATSSPEGKGLQIGKPLDFDKSESHSFSEWLKLTAVKPIDRTTKEEDQASQYRQTKLIDDFIANSPKISSPEKPVGKPRPISGTNPFPEGRNLPQAQKLLSGGAGGSFPDKLMTETLARVYLEQKNYQKAIQAYKILILKNPEKSGFFADQIRAIEKELI